MTGQVQRSTSCFDGSLQVIACNARLAGTLIVLLARGMSAQTGSPRAQSQTFSRWTPFTAGTDTLLIATIATVNGGVQPLKFTHQTITVQPLTLCHLSKRVKDRNIATRLTTNGSGLGQNFETLKCLPVSFGDRTYRTFSERHILIDNGVPQKDAFKRMRTCAVILQATKPPSKSQPRGLRRARKLAFKMACARVIGFHRFDRANKVTGGSAFFAAPVRFLKNLNARCTAGICGPSTVVCFRSFRMPKRILNSGEITANFNHDECMPTNFNLLFEVVSMTVDIAKLTLQQLEELIRRAESRNNELAKEKAEKLRETIITLAKAEGCTVEELFGNDKKTKTRRPAAMKYRNPADHRQMWSGRGKHPRWFKAALAAGQKEKDLLI